MFDCRDCKWCCKYENLPIPEGYEMLFWFKGNVVYWEPYNGKWHMLIRRQCKHLDKNGCKIYEKRPKICRDFMCPWPGSMWRRYNILADAGSAIIEERLRRGEEI